MQQYFLPKKLTKRSRRVFFLLIIFIINAPARAGESLLTIHTRQNVTVPLYYIESQDAKATVLFLTGGRGGMGKIINGQPSSKNFLIRSRYYFSENHLNVAIMGLPSDQSAGYLSYSDRTTIQHIQDIKNIVIFLKNETRVPIWLVGTSRGTISATAAAINFGNELLSGIVLTSSITDFRKIGAVPSQNLYKIKIPVLIVHNKDDECKVCQPSEVKYIFDRLSNAPIKKLVMISGGANPNGNDCGPFSYHGFIGMEQSTATLISQWIINPTP